MTQIQTSRTRTNFATEQKVVNLHDDTPAFRQEKAEVNASYYTNDLLPKLSDYCHDLLGDNLNLTQ